MSEPGYIVEIVAGSVWLAQGGSVTHEWEKRGVWATQEAALTALTASLHPDSEEFVRQTAPVFEP